MRPHLRAAGFAAHLTMLALASVLACQPVHRPGALTPLRLHATLDASLYATRACVLGRAGSAGPRASGARRACGGRATGQGRGARGAAARRGPRGGSGRGAGGARLSCGLGVLLSCGLGVRLSCGLGVLTCSLGQPCSLCVDARNPHAGALAPGALDLRRGAAEVGDHLSRAAAGHTLPRLMGRVPAIIRLVCAVVLLTGHVPIRLAFPA
jgi:hypothetical protein